MQTMKSKLFILLTINLFVQNGFSQNQEEIIKQYQKAVFLDENFIFDGKKLIYPDLKKSSDLSSTCYEDEEPFDKTTRFYDCNRKSDSREYDIIISNKKNQNSFVISYINRRGIKNYFSEIKTKTITTKIENGNVISQCVCDFNTMPEAFHQSVFYIKCHLINNKTAELLNAVFDKENRENSETWNEFIVYLNSREYKQELIAMTKIVYNDIYTSINKNIMQKDFYKYKKYDKSKVFSTLDIVREFEKENEVTIKTTNELFESKPLIREIGTNLVSKIGDLGARDTDKEVNLLELNFE